MLNAVGAQHAAPCLGHYDAGAQQDAVQACAILVQGTHPEQGAACCVPTALSTQHWESTAAYGETAPYITCPPAPGSLLPICNLSKAGNDAEVLLHNFVRPVHTKYA